MEMTRTRKIVLGLSLAASAVAGAAYAEQATRGDGVSTRAEAQAKAQEHFARMDANKDGKLDQADRAAHRTAMFDRIDADKNGQISRGEFDAMHQRGPEAGDDRGSGKHRWGGRGHHGGGMMMGRMADADRDGAVTQAEFTQAAMQRFDRADTNKDGTVTQEERRAARQAMHEQMREHWQNRADAPAAPKTN